MPRAVKDIDHTEDNMGDSQYDDWEQVAEDFGTKVEWTVGRTLVAVFNGVKHDIPVDEGDTADAATFTSEDGSEKFYCWMPFQLKEAITSGRLQEGDTVRISCTGEAPTKKNLNPVKKFDIRVKPRS